MKCDICGKGPLDGFTIFRVNEYGVPGIWRCREHMNKPIDPEDDRLARIIEEDNERKAKRV